MRRPVVLSSLLLAVCAAPAAAAPGDLDPSFGGDGQVVVPVCPAGGPVLDAVIGTLDGGVLASVTCDAGSTEEQRLVRLRADGSLDTDFGTNGSAVLPFGFFEDGVARPDGTFVGAGRDFDTGRAVIVRLSAAGAVVDVHQSTAPGSQFEDLAVAPGGGYVATGSSRATGSSPEDVLVERVDEGLQPDPGFGTAGQRLVSFVSGREFGHGVAVDPTGAVVVAGQQWQADSTTDVLVVRLRANGTNDPGFDGNGGLAIDRRTSESALGVLVRGDGRMVVALEDDALLGLLPSGAPDPAFGNAGEAAVEVGFGTPTFDAAGRIVGTELATFDASTTTAVKTFRTDGQGAFDPAWGTGGRASLTPERALRNTFVAEGLDAAGRLVLAGTTVTEAEPASILVARLQTEFPPPAPPVVVEQNPAPPAVVAPPKPPAPAADTRAPRFRHSLFRSLRKEIARNRRFGVRILPDEPGLWTVAITAETQVKVGTRFKRLPRTITSVLRRTKPIPVQAGVRTTRTVKLSPKTLTKVLARTHLRFHYTLTDAAGNTRTATFTHRLRTITAKKGS